MYDFQHNQKNKSQKVPNVKAQINMTQKLLIFHRTIAPYRIDFFNELYCAFDTRICLQYKNLMSQKFNYDEIANRFKFTPTYLSKLLRLKGRIISKGYLKNIHDFNPDIIMVGEFGPDCIIALLYRKFMRKKYKIISICDDSYNMVAENNDFSLIHKYLRKIITPHIDDLILVEPKVTKWYQETYDKGFFFPIIKNETTARAEYKNVLPLSKTIAEENDLVDKYIFLFVGRLVAIKNINTILSSFISLNAKNAVLVIIGDGIERKNLEKISEKHSDRIIFTGRLEGADLLKWYNVADCFILASYQEPFGAVTNEALLAGCKGLISEKAGSQCLIDNGKNGYTFNPYDTNELTKKMGLMMNICHHEKDYKSLRPSQMLISYNDCIKRLIQHLKQK